MKQSRVNDIIQEKESRLMGLRSKSLSAIETVRSMIDNLAKVNEQIDGQRKEIDTYMTRLSETDQGLAKTYEKNKKIAQNFINLLDGLEE